jgi:hypothetical protein
VHYSQSTLEQLESASNSAGQLQILYENNGLHAVIQLLVQTVYHKAIKSFGFIVQLYLITQILATNRLTGIG